MRAGLLPGRREVQTGGLSKEESPPYQRNPWRLCWAHHHLLWPTLKACWEHLKLRSGATPTFPLHYSRISSLHSFLGPLPPPILKSLPPKNSVALPRVVRDSILSMNARVSNKRAKFWLLFFLLGQRTTFSSSLSHPENWVPPPTSQGCGGKHK